jgi:Secretion system C-terminal sorting domain
MKKLIISIAISIYWINTCLSQCTNPSNNLVDLEAVSISPIPFALAIGQKGQIEVAVNNNTGGTNSAFIPQNQARLTVSIPPYLAFATPLNFVSTNDVTGATGLFTVNSSTAGVLQIRNSGGNFMAGQGNIITFDVVGTAVGGEENNLVLGSSLSPTSTCGDVANNQSATGRIDVTIPLPVDIISFTASPKNETAVLKWDVAQEVNVKNYEVLYGTDNVNLRVIGTVSAARSKTYSYEHTNPAKGINYYRIRSVDADGKHDYTEIRPVRFYRNGGDITVFPNPAKNLVNIQLPAEWQQKAVQIDVISSLGGLVQSGSIGASSQIESLNVSKLAAGIYTLRISSSGITAYKKLIVE